jgi:hypothetical protein
MFQGSALSTLNGTNFGWLLYFMVILAVDRKNIL